MKFGAVPTLEADGGLLAHSLKADGRTWRKAHRLTQADVLALAAAGVAELVIARLEDGDVHEDEAASRLGARLAGAGVEARRAATGRVNLHARVAGVLCVAAPQVDAVNAVHESITVGTLRPWSVVAAGDMVATVKIIPYAVREAALLAAESASQRPNGAALRVAPFCGLRVGLLMTSLAGTGSAELAKMRRGVVDRLAPLAASLQAESTVPHDAASVAATLVDWAARDDLQAVLVAGAAAIVDRADVVPAAIEAAHGHVIHVGMPVDPGNLLVLGRLSSGRRQTLPVVGIPTCARSPKVNGFDWVLQRLAAGLEVGSQDLARMGVGGLLL
ncbi:MAG: hypothetical protein RL026_1647 [Pseudomonadota bacterium]